MCPGCCRYSREDPLWKIPLINKVYKSMDCKEHYESLFSKTLFAISDFCGGNRRVKKCEAGWDKFFAEENKMILECKHEPRKDLGGKFCKHCGTSFKAIKILEEAKG